MDLGAPRAFLDSGQSDGSGKLGLKEFYVLWTKIQKYQVSRWEGTVGRWNASLMQHRSYNRSRESTKWAFKWSPTSHHSGFLKRLWDLSRFTFVKLKHSNYVRHSHRSQAAGQHTPAHQQLFKAGVQEMLPGLQAGPWKTSCPPAHATELSPLPLVFALVHSSSNCFSCSRKFTGKSTSTGLAR